METRTIITNDAQLVASPQGGQIISWKLKHIDLAGNESWHDILYQGSTIKRTGIPILFPFANPLKDDIFDYSGKTMKQHGFARECLWETEELFDSLAMILTHHDLSPEFRAVYPFEFQTVIHVSIQDNTLSYELRVANNSLENLPIAPGLHPYFPISHDIKHQLAIDGIPEFVSSDIDWNGELNGDFYSYADFQTELIYEDYTIKLNVSNKSRKPDTRHLVIWSQNTSYPDSDFVCLEPFTRATNALNTDPILVKPGTQWMQTFVYDATIIL